MAFITFVNGKFNIFLFSLAFVFSILNMFYASTIGLTYFELVQDYPILVFFLSITYSLLPYRLLEYKYYGKIIDVHNKQINSVSRAKKIYKTYILLFLFSIAHIPLMIMYFSVFYPLTQANEFVIQIFEKESNLPLHGILYENVTNIGIVKNGLITIDRPINPDSLMFFSDKYNHPIAEVISLDMVDKSENGLVIMIPQNRLNTLTIRFLNIQRGNVYSGNKDLGEFTNEYFYLPWKEYNSSITYTLKSQKIIKNFTLPYDKARYGNILIQ